MRLGLAAFIAAMTAVSVSAFAQPPAESHTASMTANGGQQGSASTKDSLDPWTLNATLEGFYEYNWNRPPDRANTLRIYDTRANTFGIQQAALVVESAPDRKENRPFGLRLDLQFGQATENTQGSSLNEPRPDAYRYVWQAYGSYVFPGSHRVQVDFGKFASNFSYETNYAKDDEHFSRSLLFAFLPGYHSGLRTQVTLNDRISVSYMLTNGVQQTEDFNEFKSNQFAAVVTPVKNVSWTINYYFGQEQPDGGVSGGPDGWLQIFDTYVTYTPTGQLSVGADANYTSNQVHEGDPKSTLTGFAGYLRYQPFAADRFALRYEYLDDSGGLFGGVPQVLNDVTLTAEHKVADGFLIRGELRHESSDIDFFPSRSTDVLKRGQTTALVGAVWWIGGKKGTW
jgi:hypothetical protein